MISGVNVLLALGLSSTAQAYLAPKPYDQIVSITDPKIIETTGQLFDNRPWIYPNAMTCTGYPAVNLVGDVSAGMAGVKDTAAQCQKGNKFPQMYVRAAQYARKYAAAYCIYLPQSIQLHFDGFAHDWSCAVLWFFNDKLEDLWLTRKGRVLKEDWEWATFPHLALLSDVPNFSDDGAQAWNGTLLRMKTPDAFVNYLNFNVKDVPLVNYDKLPALAKQALEEFEFGGHPCPLRDFQSGFANLLGNSYEPPDWLEVHPPSPTTVFEGGSQEKGPPGSGPAGGVTG